MILKTITVGPNETNCYILGCSRTKEAALIDPGAEADLIKKAARDAGVKLKYIINTHGHADHIAANKDFKLPVFIHKLDSEFLTDPYKNMSVFFGFSITSPSAERFLEDGEVMKVGDIVMDIMHTPGHTPGGISIKAEGVVFTGDTLFADGVGRTDLPGSSDKDLFKSIKNKLMTLPDDTVVYPGHGSSSTIGRERANF